MCPYSFSHALHYTVDVEKRVVDPTDTVEINATSRKDHAIPVIWERVACDECRTASGAEARH